ncbi:MAG: hypothetical protein DRH37_10850 [Deltaproteobacteria bacterium]|nr:MAG: hypothetical protein DRH37_10850 [Deltaproteobacteria bacterium]
MDVGRIPMARNFEKMGQVIMRSGSGPEDVYCLFACGGELKQHRQYDALSFIIYSDDGFLAIDSGDRSGCGGDYEHLLNYYSQSIAHNTLLVHQPDEPLTTYWGRKLSVMDGGQHDVAASRLEAFETNDAYTYVAGDATGCYFHGGDLPEKVSWVTRQMVFLPPNIFVIFDRVNSTRPEYPKTWLLHTVNRPQRSGDTVYADHGKSRLFCRTLLPENAEISTIGGPGKEFWSAGRNWPLPVTQETEDEMKKYETAGRWRVEVQPAEQRLNDYFLHVLQVTGQNVEEMTEIQLLQTDKYYGTELNINGDRWKIQFNRTGSSGGKIACEGNTNLSQGLAQTVQPQSGIFTKGESSKAGWMERLLRIFRRN